MFNSNAQGLNPFYLFQLYTVVLWSLQYYWKFAVIIAVTSVISVTVSVWETRRVRLFIISFFSDSCRISKTFSDSILIYRYVRLLVGLLDGRSAGI